MCKLNNCNPPNESSHDLKWAVVTRIQTRISILHAEAIRYTFVSTTSKSLSKGLLTCERPKSSFKRLEILLMVSCYGNLIGLSSTFTVTGSSVSYNWSRSLFVLAARVKCRTSHEPNLMTVWVDSNN